MAIRTILTVAAATLPFSAAGAQTEQTLLDIAQSGIGSNGFGTTWRGQDIELDEDAWLTRVVLQTGSATVNVDEIRLMTAVPGPTTLRTATNLAKTNTAVEAVLPAPYLLRAATRYTVWFHQNGSPRGTSGCDLSRVDPTWLAWHTNVDPTQAPGPGEPGYFWGYKYGTNLRLIGFDNLEITGNLVPGGSAQLTLEARPNDVAFVLFATGTADLSLPPFTGPLRLSPPTIAPASFAGSVGPTGIWVNTLSIPADPGLKGLRLYTQGLYDASFAAGGTFSPRDEIVVQ